MPFMSGVSAVIQNLYSSTDSTVAYFVHFVSVPQVQAAHVAEAGYNTGLQSYRAQPWFTMSTNMHVILCGERSK